MAEIADVMRALFERCKTIDTGSPALPIVFPEPRDVFEPPADGKYLEVAFFSNRPAWEGKASGRMDQGLLQVTVVWPKNKGLLAPSRIAQAVIEHFPLALTLHEGSAKVTINRQPYQAAPLIEPSEVRIPVTISWTA